MINIYTAILDWLEQHVFEDTIISEIDFLR